MDIKKMLEDYTLHLDTMADRIKTGRNINMIDLEEFTKVVAAAIDGKPVQRRIKGVTPWSSFNPFSDGVWHSRYEYRVKPREPRVIYIGENNDGSLNDKDLYEEDHYVEGKPVKFVEVLED